jgi:hypothetical protein
LSATSSQLVHNALIQLNKLLFLHDRLTILVKV